MGQCLKVWGHMEQEVLPARAQLTTTPCSPVNMRVLKAWHDTYI